MLKPTVVAIMLLPGLVTMTHPAVAGTLPATLAKAVAGADLDTPDAFSFRKTSLVSAMGKKTVRTVTRWDPSKPADQRCTVVSVEVLRGDASDGKDEKPCSEEHDRETYADLKQSLETASSIELVSENESEAVYRVVPADGKHGIQTGGINIDVGEDKAKDMIGTVHVTKTGPGAPYVDRYALQLKKPAGNLLASVRKLDITFTYAPDAASGAKLLRSMDLDLQLTLFAALDIDTVVSNHYDEYKRIQ